ncbi:hypothetical protein Tco_0191496 [Tanacetum coccineum]
MLTFTTVKCIPHGCRLAFSQALKTVLCKVVAQPDFVDAWVRGKDHSITSLLKSILDGFMLGSFVQEDRVKGNTNIKQCLRKVADGHFTKAVKVISSSDTSCERDGLRAQHILDALCGEGSATAIDLLKVIASVVNLWLTGRCPPIFAKFIASAPLTPLLKPDNRIRPIAVGTIWRCLVSKVSMKGVGKEMSKSLAMLTVDFLNAFNLVYRSASLHEQGDPLGPILFAFVLHLLVHKIKDSCKLLLHAWYLDDETVIEDSEEVAKVFDIIKLREGLFHIDIRRPSSGVKLVGGDVSRDANFISRLAMRRATNVVDLMTLLPRLHDPQNELLLLRSCMGIAKLFFGLRTCQPVHMEEADLCGSIKNIMVCGGPFFETYSGDLLLYPFDLVVWVCTRQKWFPLMLLWPRGPNLGCYKTTSYMTVAYVVWMMIMFVLWLVFVIRFQALILAVSLIRTSSLLKPNKHWISAMKEARVNFFTDPSDGRSTLRPADVLVFGWIGGKHAWI